MDSSVIEEIANQLGMAVDQAGAFITEQLPAFAALKVMQNEVPLMIVGLLFVIATIVSFVGVYKAVKCAKSERKLYKEDREKSIEKIGYGISNHGYKTEPSDHDSFLVFLYVGVVAAFLLVFLVVTALITVPDIIGWSNYPEAMLIDMALKAV